MLALWKASFWFLEANEQWREEFPIGADRWLNSARMGRRLNGLHDHFRHLLPLNSQCSPRMNLFLKPALVAVERLGRGKIVDELPNLTNKACSGFNYLKIKRKLVINIFNLLLIFKVKKI